MSTLLLMETISGHERRDITPIVPNVKCASWFMASYLQVQHLATSVADLDDWPTHSHTLRYDFWRCKVLKGTLLPFSVFFLFSFFLAMFELWTGW